MPELNVPFDPSYRSDLAHDADMHRSAAEDGEPNARVAGCYGCAVEDSPVGSVPATVPASRFTWIDRFVGVCDGCGDRFRLSVEALAYSIEDNAEDAARLIADGTSSDDWVPFAAQFCAACVVGPEDLNAEGQVPGEKDGLVQPDNETRRRAAARRLGERFEAAAAAAVPYDHEPPTPDLAPDAGAGDHLPDDSAVPVLDRDPRWCYYCGRAGGNHNTTCPRYVVDGSRR